MILSPKLRRAVGIVALANLAYFGVEFAVALHIGSVSLFADSVDFLEDASVNFLILLALNWSLKARGRLGIALAALLLWPTAATLWMAWQKFAVLIAPNPTLLSVTGCGALAVNMTCAFTLARYRHHGGSLTKAAFLSARNDAIANIAIILSGLLTAVVNSGWPDLAVGLGIALLNLGAAKEVWEAAHKERSEARKENFLP
jgi:Co/Zn/Cd efflux system component